MSKKTPGRLGGRISRLCDKSVPAVVSRLGMKDADHTAPVHNERFNFNDKAIATGAAVLASIALTRMVSNS